jgi:methionine-rich copper-binding protein CopC
LITVLVLFSPAAAWAHGDAITTVPAAGDRVRSLPKFVEIDFTEPPTQDSHYEVIDGCGDDVLAAVSGDGNLRHLSLAGGEPGKWKVTYRVISATDGHPTRDRFSFRVAGSKDCREPAPGDDETPDIGEAGAPIESDDGSGFSAGPILIGGAAILILAVVIRVLASRGTG